LPRALARPEQVPDGEALVPWFYRTLRNAPSTASGGRARPTARSRPLPVNWNTPRRCRRRPGDEVCQCISRLATTLKPEYADALQAIEVEGQPVKSYAERQG
jgi:RNA polymerase sigma-70 factor (ECF subfamily)